MGVEGLKRPVPLMESQGGASRIDDRIEFVLDVQIPQKGFEHPKFKVRVNHKHHSRIARPDLPREPMRHPRCSLPCLNKAFVVLEFIPTRFLDGRIDLPSWMQPLNIRSPHARMGTSLIDPVSLITSSLLVQIGFDKRGYSQQVYKRGGRLERPQKRACKDMARCKPRSEIRQCLGLLEPHGRQGRVRNPLGLRLGIVCRLGVPNQKQGKVSRVHSI